MGMFSEITTEGSVGTFLRQIKHELEANKEKAEVCAVLRKLGRFGLSQFEWTAPEWAKGYEELFKEKTAFKLGQRVKVTKNTFNHADLAVLRGAVGKITLIEPPMKNNKACRGYRYEVSFDPLEGPDDISNFFPLYECDLEAVAPNVSA